MEKYDCIIIGGGPAGMMAAISASEEGNKVLLLEKNDCLGKKLLLTGNGRCNFSHREDTNKDFALKFGKYGDFLLSLFSIFGPKETFDFFQQNKLELMVERDGKIFPRSNRSKNILDVLVKLLEKNRVEISFNSEVEDIIFQDGRIEKVILSNGKDIEGSNFIITTGGKSFPTTGSDGKGLELIKKMGHSISSLYPGLCPLKINNVVSLSGISFKDIGVSFSQSGKYFLKGRGDVMFAHFGITGPVILDLSNELSDRFEKGKVILFLDFFPDKNIEEFSSFLERNIEDNKNKEIKNILSLIMPEKISLFILDILLIDHEKKGLQLGKKEKDRIVKALKKFELTVDGFLGFEDAMITKGGVLLKEIDARTMRSKIISNLYFAGEIIDLSGICGGYNLQMCWSTGYVAGRLRT
jgi:hypothetical protein